jgi:hypothetical protein
MLSIGKRHRCFDGVNSGAASVAPLRALVRGSGTSSVHPPGRVTGYGRWFAICDCYSLDNLPHAARFNGRVAWGDVRGRRRIGLEENASTMSRLARADYSVGANVQVREAPDEEDDDEDESDKDNEENDADEEDGYSV